MRKYVTALLPMAALIVCTPVTDANAQAKKTTRGSASRPAKPLTSMDMMRDTNDVGGTTGCYDPRKLDARAQRVAERLGSRPCEDTTPRPPAPVASKSQPRPVSGASWIVGSWVERDSQCAGDSGITYLPDGRFTSSEALGRWTLQGKTLTVTIFETYELGDEGPPKRLRTPRRIVTTVLVFNARAYIEGDSKGQITHMKKCG